MMKISLILEAINRATGPIDGILRSLRALRGAAETTGAVVSGMARRIGRSFMGMNDFVVDATHHFRALAGDEGMARAARSAEYLKRQVSGLTTGLSILKYASAAAAVGLGEEFVRGVFNVGGETQTMLVTLTRLEGSATRAQRAMAWMQNFAIGAGARFTMPDIMRSYQMATNFGMNPQGGSMSAFADLAAGERVSMKQVLYAVKDAMEGTSVRPLANLGIKMKQGRHAGDPNSYLYSLGGKFITEHSAKTPEAVLKTLTRIIEAKYSGMALAQAKTLPGGIATAKNALWMFESKVAGVGTGGVYDWGLGQLNRFILTVRKATADGSLDRLAKKISNFITSTGDKLINFFVQTDWKAVGKDLKGLAAILGSLASVFGLFISAAGGGLSGLFNLFVISKIVGITSALMGLGPVIAALITVITGFEIAAGPIEVVIAVIGALIAIGYLLWANWDTIVAKLKSLWKGLNTDLTPGITTTIAIFSPLIGLPLLIIKNWSPLVGFFRNLWHSISNWQPPSWMRWLAGGALALTGNPVQAAQVLAPGAFRPKAAAPRPGAGVKGHITVEFVGEERKKMWVRSMSSSDPNFDLFVKRGGLMRGPK